MALELEQRVAKLEVDMQAVKELVQQNALAIAQLATASRETDQRISNLTSEVSRVLGNVGDRVSRNEAAIETLAALTTRILQNGEADRAESKAFRNEIRGTTSRLDALVNYLIRGDQG